MSKEEVLKGGNVNHIVRMANTVRRPIGYWSPNVHELLKHLEKQGYEGAPKFLGIDDSGREILTFISGEVAGNNYPNLEPYMWTDETLVGLAHLIRRFHDVTTVFRPNMEDRWQLSYADDAEHEVICHNDAALYNVVFQRRLLWRSLILTWQVQVRVCGTLRTPFTHLFHLRVLHLTILLEP